MLRNDLSHLPSETKPEGLAPDPDPVYVKMLVDEIAKGGTWGLAFDYHTDKPQVSDTMTRHSAAGSCLKRVALQRDGVDEKPMDPAGLWVTFLGTMAHDAWQRALEAQYGDRASFEVATTIEDLTSGSCDALIEPVGGCGKCAWALNNDNNVLPCDCDPKAVRHVLELKTAGGTKYKRKVGFRCEAEGPDSSAIVQLALNVMGHDADRGTLIYIATEGISKGAAEKANMDDIRRLGAQWTFSREQLQPLADEWLERLRWVRDHETDEVPRFWPDETPLGARIVDPNSSRWELRDGDDIIDTGSVWGGQGCSYCPTQEACAKAWADGR